MSYYNDNDTIAAIATGLIPSGIGIIRVSGKDSIDIVNKIFVNKNFEHNLHSFKSHTIHYGFIVDNDVFLDEVMVSVMYSPYTFTRENVVEINSHGGIYILNKVLDLLVHSGARLAEPGEFSKRAFLNGRIDLTQAEGIMDLISSDSEYSHQASLSLIRGHLKEKIDKIRKQILNEIAFIEAGLDDPEHIDLDEHEDAIISIIDNFLYELNILKSSFSDGKVIKEGIKCVILGKPNVGKSTLINYLSDSDTSIVTDIPGTTRDVIEVSVRINNLILHFFDTAGIRDTSDEIEKIGVSRTLDNADNCDLLIWVIDSSNHPDSEDYKCLEVIKKNLDKNIIILFNKNDLLINNNFLSDYISLLIENGLNIDIKTYNENSIQYNFPKDYPEVKDIGLNTIYALYISAFNGDGINNLKSLISDKFNKGYINYNNQLYITNQRHFNEINSALESMLLVKEGIEMSFPIDMVTIDFMNAYKSLSSIVGEDISEDLVNEIFSNFCMGK